MLFLLPLGVALLIAAMFLKYQIFYISLAIASFAYYFGIQGDNAFILLLFLIGIALMVAELYIPDFGIMGVLGLGASIYALWLKIGALRPLIVLVLLCFLTAVVLSIILMRMGFALNISPRFVLQESMISSLGYSSESDYSYLVNQEGVTMTDLRPVGRAQFDDEIYDVYSLEDMIGHGRQIRVVRVAGSKIYVRSVE